MAKKKRPTQKRLKVIRSRRSQNRHRMTSEQERAKKRREAKRTAFLRSNTPEAPKMEAVIARLKGVKAARVVTEDGILQQIHVVTDTRWSLRQIRFIIRIALSARFGFSLPPEVWINQARFEKTPPQLRGSENRNKHISA